MLMSEGLRVLLRRGVTIQSVVNDDIKKRHDCHIRTMGDIVRTEPQLLSVEAMVTLYKTSTVECGSSGDIVQDLNC